MGMALLKTGGGMSFDEWKRVASPWRVVDAAQHDNRALDAAVVRIIDTMLELQLDCRHENPGYTPFSPTALMGEMPGGGGRSDQAMLAALRYHPESQWHVACGKLMDQLPKRQAAAMLMQAARVRPEKMGNSVWMVTARQMVERQDTLLRYIGYRSAYLMPTATELEERKNQGDFEEFEATAIRPFESVNALQHAARRARSQLRTWLAQGDVSSEVAPAL